MIRQARFVSSSSDEKWKSYGEVTFVEAAEMHMRDHAPMNNAVVVEVRDKDDPERTHKFNVARNTTFWAVLV